MKNNAVLSACGGVTTKAFILAGLLVVIAMAAYWTETVQATSTDSPICVAWEAWCSKGGASERYNDGYTVANEIVSFGIHYYCLTDNGIVEFSNRTGIDTRLMEGNMEYFPYQIELLPVGDGEEPMTDELGMPIAGYLLSTSAYPSVSFEIAAHTLVGGFNLDVWTDVWYDVGDGEGGTMGRGHYWEFRGSDSWASPGYEYLLQ